PAHSTLILRQTAVAASRASFAPTARGSEMLSIEDLVLLEAIRTQQLKQPWLATRLVQGNDRFV
ncbi:hypothetical protein, partial [Pseudomonas protegens]|uniref:hypothetical protein n=1 Tax=Pseudomonas protegens TaxID=380021 RepID=UPI001C83790D